MTDFAEALSEIQDQGLRLRRAWPAADGVLHLDVVVGGIAMAGQFCSRPLHLQRILQDLPPDSHHAGRILLQRCGIDRKLRTLAGRVLRGTADLVSHRPERRAVLRTGSGDNSCYTKVVRAQRKAGLLESSLAAMKFSVPTPSVLTHDADSVTISNIPGRSLHELLAGPALGPAERIGQMLRNLHRTPVPETVAHHDAAAEAAVTDAWSQRAAAWGIELPARTTDAWYEPGDQVLLHRDLHDKQIIVNQTADGTDVGLIDFDLMAVGDAALDLANLMVHLELRAAQGLCPDAPSWRDGILQGYQPSEVTRRQLPWYEHQARHRLAAVYGFRPGPAHRWLVAQLQQAK